MPFLDLAMWHLLWFLSVILQLKNWILTYSIGKSSKFFIFYWYAF